MNKVNLSTYNNSWFSPGNKVKIILWYFFNILFFKSSFPYPNGLKIWVLRLFGASLGQSIVIKPGVNIKYPWLLHIGDNVWIGENVWIDNLAKVTILDNVCISQGAMLLCGNHNYKLSTFDLIVKTIYLDEGVWIGAKSVVCPGVICGSHSILSVGSIANKYLEPYTIYQGNPAIAIRKREIS